MDEADALPQRTAQQAGVPEGVTPKGEEIRLEFGRMFVAGQRASTRTALVAFHDFFGYGSARTHFVAADLAQRLRALVVCTPSRPKNAHT